MAARPRLLFLAQCLPYPPHSGAASRTFNILRQLQADYDIDLVPFFRLNHHPDGAARDAGRDMLGSIPACVAEPTPIASEHSLTRKIWDHVRSVASGRPYTYYLYDSRAFASRLRAILRTRTPDLVHLESLDLHGWLANLPQVPIACTHQNIESDLLRRHTPEVKSSVLRYYLRFQAGRLEHVERQLCPQLALNVMVSEVDARRLGALAPGAVTAVVPNGTDTEYFRPSDVQPVPGRVAFVGPTYSYPNWDAVEFLVQDIWPRVRAANRSASLRLIGRGPPAHRTRYEAEADVTTLGYVPDIRPPLSEACCCVVPIRIGGGTRLKILDAWAMGKAVVSTSVGCEGLDVVNEGNILVRDSADAFAEGVLQVLGDPRLRSRLERNGRRTAIETYSWGVIGERIRSAYGELLSRSASVAAAYPGRMRRWNVASHA